MDGTTANTVSRNQSRKDKRCRSRIGLVCLEARRLYAELRALLANLGPTSRSDQMQGIFISSVP